MRSMKKLAYRVLHRMNTRAEASTASLMGHALQAWCARHLLTFTGTVQPLASPMLSFATALLQQNVQIVKPLGVWS